MVAESGSDLSGYADINQYTLASDGSWPQTAGDSQTSTSGYTQWAYSASGGYSYPIAGGSVSGSWRQSGSASTSYDTATDSTLGSNGQWTTTGATDNAEGGTQHIDCSGSGSYVIAASVGAASLSGSGSVEESGTDDWSYGYTTQSTIGSSGTWLPATGSGGMTETESNQWLYAASGSYSRPMDGGTLTGQWQAGGGASGGYTAQTVSTLNPDGSWTTTGAADSSGSGSGDWAYSGSGSFSQSTSTGDSDNGSDSSFSSQAAEDYSQGWSSQYTVVSLLAATGIVTTVTTASASGSASGNHTYSSSGTADSWSQTGDYAAGNGTSSETERLVGRVAHGVAAIAVAGELRHQRRPDRHDHHRRCLGQQPGQRRRLLVTHGGQRLRGIGEQRLRLFRRLGHELGVGRQRPGPLRRPVQLVGALESGGHVVRLVVVRDDGGSRLGRRDAHLEQRPGWSSQSYGSGSGSGHGSGSSTSFSTSGSDFQRLRPGRGLLRLLPERRLLQRWPPAADGGWRWGVGWPGGVRNGPLGPSAYSGLGYVFAPGDAVSIAPIQDQSDAEGEAVSLQVPGQRRERRQRQRQRPRIHGRCAAARPEHRRDYGSHIGHDRRRRLRPGPFYVTTVAFTDAAGDSASQTFTWSDLRPGDADEPRRSVQHGGAGGFPRVATDVNPGNDGFFLDRRGPAGRPGPRPTAA